MILDPAKPDSSKNKYSKSFGLLDLNKGWIILLSMSLSSTVHLWIPSDLERNKRHNFCAWLPYMTSLLSPLTLMPFFQTVSCVNKANKIKVGFHLNSVHSTPFDTMWHNSLWRLFSNTCCNPAITLLNMWGVEYCSGAVVFFQRSSGLPWTLDLEHTRSWKWVWTVVLKSLFGQVQWTFAYLDMIPKFIKQYASRSSRYGFWMIETKTRGVIPCNHHGMAGIGWVYIYSM